MIYPYGVDLSTSPEILVKMGEVQTGSVLG